MPKIYNTVQTEKRAKEILIEENATSFNNKSCLCECGETLLKIGYNNDFEVVGSVAICESCGDDDAIINEVLYK